MKKHLSIAIRSPIESAREFAQAWRRNERGEPPEHPVERLYFEDLPTMLKTLTPRRFEVLKIVHEIGPVSVRALAAKMKRDYKNVYQDIKVLERVGLVMRSSDGRLTAPWTKIIAEFALAA
jgi:predicted transcriptional regulator